MASTYEILEDTFESEATFDSPVDATSAPGENDTSEAADGDPKDPMETLGHKRAMTRSVIAAFTAASAAAATLPLPYKGAILLSPIELAEVHALATVYDIPNGESVSKLLDALVQLGAVSLVAHGALDVLDKGIKLKIASTAKSAAIAGIIVAGVGIGTAYLFEQVYLGNRSASGLGIGQKIRKTEAWQRVSKTVTDNLQKVIDKDSVEGLKIFVREMADAYSPEKVMKQDSVDGLKVFASEMSKIFNPLA